MNNLNFIDLTDIEQQNKYVATKSEPIGSCNNRCKYCPLFPYEKLSIKGINETRDRAIFDVNGQQHKLTHHGFRLMCALTRYSGSILSREFLSEYVWPESNVVSNNLNVAIYDLRIVFSNSSINIENYRKEGYGLTL
ncbi:winged helix-turn-helix domain-containing protein [Colwellia sp. 12G3]|uniref:winged helix-turn-helix domain-containing protein n=1 Tax=Colwellia sp. 12G3 TaxID=2058299 RepID=UPI001E40CD05|nr:winged helix-turn-helix domain-containing protein [Colwellia sp. 12G3]